MVQGAATLKDSTAYGQGDTAYAVVLYTQTVDEKEYYIGNYGTWYFENAVNKSQGNMGKMLNGTSTTALSWATASVPEPTSGLLMLLGMAGLALRRRRA